MCSFMKVDFALLISLAVCLCNRLYLAILSGEPLLLAHRYILCLRLVLRLSSGVNQGKCWRLEAILLGTGTQDLTEDVIWSLNLVQFSSTVNWAIWEIKDDANDFAASFILPQFALKNICTVQGLSSDMLGHYRCHKPLLDDQKYQVLLIHI